MEKMQISLISVVHRKGILVARARAEAKQVRIWVEVCFEQESGGAGVWCQARDKVLRYLDPA